MNLSFSQGEFPSPLKIATVTPIFKAGDPELPTNYRPISILPVFTKVIEKIVCKRLNKYLHDKDILSKSQFGFRRGLSTEMPLVLTTNFIHNALDQGDHVLGIFLDLEKAFDVVSHDILLMKMEFYGIRGTPLSWFRSYLANRKQAVRIPPIVSEYREVACGVPQGSVLGPQLFLLFINDLCSLTSPLKFFLFADDTTLLLKGPNLNDLVTRMNNELVNLSQWFQSNKLSLNISKSQCIIFSLNPNVRNSSISVKINETQLKQTSHTRFLGVIVDNRLSWNEHVDHHKD